MREEMARIYELLNRIEVKGCQSVKNLAVALENTEQLIRQLDSGALVVRRREEGAHEAGNQRQRD